MSYFPSDYITRWEANRGLGMKAPSRHEDWRVRAIWFKRERNEQRVVLSDCSKPSTEWDRAFDRLADAIWDYENTVTSQLLHRLAANANHVPTVSEPRIQRKELEAV